MIAIQIVRVPWTYVKTYDDTNIFAYHLSEYDN